jgi:trans-feruloyl-CoA hydratase/vanillin synthase
MDDKQARDYLKSKQDSLSKNDKEIREQHGMKQFLDEKSYRPGLGPFRKVENV